MHVKVEFWLSSRERTPKLADWLVLKNGSADLIDPLTVGSTQYEVLGL